MGKLLLKSSPHLQDADTVPGIMWSVVLALLPAVAMSLYFFGLSAISVYLQCIVTAVAAEVICLKIREKPIYNIYDGSAFLTGLLTAMVLPPGSPPWVCIVAAGFAIAIVKHCFGGLGHNIWNPALAGRVFVQFAYPADVSLSEWMAPRMLFGAAPDPDAITQASPLAEQMEGYFDMFVGNGVAGSLGETCKLALLIGGIYLIAKNIIDWRVPFYYIGTLFILTALLPNGSATGTTPFYHILSGGLFLGAFFMATDMVTSPVTKPGRIIFAVGCGIMTALIRMYGGYPEGVAYSILFMNTLAPLIDRYAKPRIYGSKTKKPE